MRIYKRGFWLILIATALTMSLSQAKAGENETLMIKDLVIALRGESSNIRSAVAKALDKIGNPQEVKPLIALLKMDKAKQRTSLIVGENADIEENTEDSGDAWGPVHTTGLQAGIRIVDSGRALEVVLKGAKKRVLNIYGNRLWTFHFRDKTGLTRTSRPEKQPGMEGLILLRGNETRRGKIRILDIFPDLDLTTEYKVWATTDLFQEIKSGIVTVKGERIDDRKKDSHGLMSQMDDTTPKGKRKYSYRKYNDYKLYLIFEKAEQELAVNWGSKEGPLRCGILLSNKSVLLNEALNVELFVENAGDSDLIWHRIEGFPCDWSISVKGPDGEFVKKTWSFKKNRTRIIQGSTFHYLLRAGEIARVQVPITEWFLLNQPGKYDLFVSVHGDFSGSGLKIHRLSASNHAKFTVLKL